MTDQNTPGMQAVRPAPTSALKKFQEETVDRILAQVTDLSETGALQIPKDYHVGNQLKLAWLRLLETETRDKKPVLEACTKESICNALLEMVIQGLSVAKKQVDFIAYGDRLTLQREYHGTIALAMRLGGVKAVPTGSVVYQDDVFDFAIDPATGRRHILKHEQKLNNIDTDKIVGAYAVIPLQDGTTHVEVMTIQQIKQSWMQGATKGQSPAHRNFPDQMAIKTVISRGCKLFISSSQDAGLIRDPDEFTDNTAPNTSAPGSHQPPKEKAAKVRIQQEIEEAILIEPKVKQRPEQPKQEEETPTTLEKSSIPDWAKE